MTELINTAISSHSPGQSLTVLLMHSQKWTFTLPYLPGWGLIYEHHVPVVKPRYQQQPRWGWSDNWSRRNQCGCDSRPNTCVRHQRCRVQNTLPLVDRPRCRTADEDTWDNLVDRHTYVQWQLTLETTLFTISCN